MRRAWAILVLVVFFAAPVNAAPSASFPLLRSFVQFLLNKAKCPPAGRNSSPTGWAIIKTGSGTIILNSNSGTYSGGGSIYSGSLILTGGTINLGGIGSVTGSGTLTLAYINVPGRTVFAGEDVEFVLNSILLAGTITYQWQSSSNQGTTWTDLVDDTEISGSHGNRLIVRQVDKSMNGWLFRCLVYSNGILINPAVLPGLLTVQ